VEAKSGYGWYFFSLWTATWPRRLGFIAIWHVSDRAGPPHFFFNSVSISHRVRKPTPNLLTRMCNLTATGASSGGLCSSRTGIKPSWAVVTLLLSVALWASHSEVLLLFSSLSPSSSLSPPSPFLLCYCFSTSTSGGLCSSRTGIKPLWVVVTLLLSVALWASH
jgi:hypothetical protein